MDIRREFEKIDELSLISNTGGRRRAAKGEMVENFIKDSIGPMLKSRGYYTKKYRENLDFNSSLEIDIGIFDHKNCLIYGIEAKDYADSTQMRASLLSHSIIFKRQPTLQAIITISMHSGSKEDLRKFFIDHLSLTGKAFSYNILPIKRDSKKPSYINQFSDDELNSYRNKMIDFLSNIIK